ncbi:transmembrane protein 241 isoform X2 [Lampris incognitus]|uniref:transmembrane protein 241 isoform X2 n=1 Tax=Lampris incognitus TaxID=2546036 RepID=UPI0024B51670|nr:transmembrane protein 241 isoform X2 [Lampris incognitus]
MQWRRHVVGLTFSIFFISSCFTNKYVLSVLKFTYPTLFQGWQTCIGALLLLVSGKTGWLEMSRITRSAALSWLPGSILFVGNIYAGSRALSRMDIPIFFTLQNSSHVVGYLILRLVHGERMPWLKHFSIFVLLGSAINLPFYDPEFEMGSYTWAIGHLSCVGAYRVFKVQSRSSHLSDLEQQYINYLFSALLLATAAHPTGDLLAALDFPSLRSYTFHCGCCASALLGFVLLLATVKLRSGLSVEHSRAWTFLAKIAAMFLSPFVFSVTVNAPSSVCVLCSHVAEGLLIYSERPTYDRERPAAHQTCPQLQS